MDIEGWGSNGVPDSIYKMMRKESQVNGVWAGILSIYFPFPEFIIAPEHWTEVGVSRGDLIVIHCDSGKTVFTFEGKKEGINDSQWTAGTAQIQKYLSDGLRQIGQVGYGMLASGTDCAMLCWFGGQLYRFRSTFTDLDNNIIREDINGKAETIHKVFGDIQTRIKTELSRLRP